MTMNLDELAIQFKTDKSSKVHNYCKRYDIHVSPFRNDPITLVEIGVKNGASLKMWEAYFPNAQIIGVDINEDCKRFAGGRISILVGDQADEGFWIDFLEDHPTIHIVIDDGGHTSEQQQITMDVLYPHTKLFYCVEDLQVAHIRRFTNEDYALTTEVLADVAAGMHRTGTPSEFHAYPGLCILGGLY